jgi:hypothetical protein
MRQNGLPHPLQNLVYRVRCSHINPRVNLPKKIHEHFSEGTICFTLGDVATHRSARASRQNRCRHLLQIHSQAAPLKRRFGVGRVEAPVARHPPHRSGRAAFPHPAPQTGVPISRPGSARHGRCADTEEERPYEAGYSGPTTVVADHRAA